MPDISSSLSKREVNARQNTYTKSEIDLKDGAIQAIAEAAQTTADAAEKKNQEQDQLIAELQKSSHSHSNQDVLDKTEQPYTTAERDKLAGLENYTHPTHTAHKKEFYKFASDGEGHVTDAEKVTASDLYNAGGVIQSALNLYDYRGYIPLSFMTLYYGGGLKNIAEILFLDRDSNKQREIRLCLGSYNDRSTGCLNLVDYNGCQYILEPNPDSPGTQAYIFYFPKQSGTIALTKDIPDISGKQDKSTAVTHTANTAVGSTAKPVYIAADGKATPIMHSINSDVPANAKFTDTTYSDATQSAHGLMTAADKKKLDGMDLSKYLPLHGTADQSKALSNGSMRYGWCVNNAANAGSGYRWFRIGTMTASKNGYDTETLYMHICNGNNIYGVIGVYTRTDSTGTGIENMRVSWLVRDSSPHHAQFKLVGIASSTGVKFELWCYTSARWYQTAYYVIADLVLTGGLSNRWVLEKHGDSDAKNATTVGTKSVTDVDLSYAAKANEAASLTDSGWVNCPLAVTGNTTYPTSASTIRVRKYGKMVKLEGWVKYSTAFNTGHNVATIPDGYRPANAMNIIGATNTGAGTKIVFYATIGAGGNIGFSPADQNSSATFNPAACYEFQATYFID